VLISRYRFALEQALAKAEFLTTSDIVTLQAFVIFLILVRRHDDTRFAWTLTGLVIRISQSIGLHRDGTAFPGLTPFQIEERRRLFWAIAVLDLRSAEDQGTDLTIMDRTFETRLPLNINDSDIDPSAIEFPPERDTPTDMTFSLVRYEICALARRMHTVTSALAPVCPRDADSTLEQRERMLLDTFKHVEEKYLKDSSAETNPVYWVAANIARVIVAKMTLIIYQPVLFPGPGDEDLSGDVRDRLFNAAIDIFEYSHVLNTDPRCRNWRWLFQTYTQWHALAQKKLSHQPSHCIKPPRVSPDPLSLLWDLDLPSFISGRMRHSRRLSTNGCICVRCSTVRKAMYITCVLLCPQMAARLGTTILRATWRVPISRPAAYGGCTLNAPLSATPFIFGPSLDVTARSIEGSKYTCGST